MKKLAIAAFAMFTVLATQAQNNVISSQFSDYASKENVTKVSVTGKMFSMFADLDAENAEEQEMLEAFSSIEGIEVLAGETGGKGFLETATGRLSRGFEELMSVSEKDHDVVVHINESNGVVEEFLIIVEGQEEWAIVDIYGAFDLNVVASVAREMQVSGLEHYDGQLVEAAREISFYPNPAPADKGATINITEPLLGSTYQITDGSGRVVKTGVLNNKTTEVELQGLSAGSYILILNKDNAKLFSETLVVQ